MIIYLNGAEYKTYREILIDCGVRYACINYEYLYYRTPQFDFSDLCYFDGLIATPGDLAGYRLESYEEFLNENWEHFDFALSPSELKDCKVKILLPYGVVTSDEYYINEQILAKPFSANKFKNTVDNIHSIEIEKPYISSMNSGTWMRGKAGWISRFDAKNEMRMLPSYTRAAVARELVEEGYKINLNKVKRNEWKEVAKVNCIAWKKYQDWRLDG